MNILITICARGGSKGIPQKNIKLMAGKPLINYTINTAQRFADKYRANIVLSTDDTAIKVTAANAGINTEYMRPDFLATDTAGKIDTIKDVLLYEEKRTGVRYDYVLDLDVTSPLRTRTDLEKGLEIIQNKQNALTLFSVSPAARNPYFNMVEMADSGFYTLVKRSNNGTALSRQAAPAVYDLNASFYFYRREFFDLDIKSPITDKSLIYIMDHLCFDLDHPIDFEFLTYLIVNKKLDFDF